MRSLYFSLHKNIYQRKIQNSDDVSATLNRDAENFLDNRTWGASDRSRTGAGKASQRSRFACANHNKTLVSSKDVTRLIFRFLGIMTFHWGRLQRSLFVPDSWATHGCFSPANSTEWYESRLHERLKWKTHRNLVITSVLSWPLIGLIQFFNCVVHSRVISFHYYFYCVFGFGRTDERAVVGVLMHDGLLPL